MTKSRKAPAPVRAALTLPKPVVEAQTPPVTDETKDDATEGEALISEKGDGTIVSVETRVEDFTDADAAPNVYDRTPDVEVTELGNGTVLETYN